MARARTILILGIWTAVLPYLGFPIFFKNILFVLTGLFFVYISFTIYKESKVDTEELKNFENFSENKDFSDNIEN